MIVRSLVGRRSAWGLASLLSLGLLAAEPPLARAQFESDLLESSIGVAVSPGGEHVYVSTLDTIAGGFDHYIVVFSRDGVTGQLTLANYLLIPGKGVRRLLVSPDGAHVYGLSEDDARISVFSRDGGTGAVTFVEEHVDGVGGVDGLDGARSFALSPDGAHLYVASDATDDAVAVFSRDAATGELTFVEAQFDGPGGVDGLNGPRSVAVSADGAHVYVGAHVDGTVVVFSRDAGTGALTFVEAEDVSGQPEAVAVSPDGAHVYVGTRGNGVSSALSTLSRDALTGELTFVKVMVAEPFMRSMRFSPDGVHLYVRAGGIVAYTRDSGTGFLTKVGSQPQTLGALTSMRISPDGAQVYTIDFSRDEVQAYDRDAGTGALTSLEVYFGSATRLRVNKFKIVNAVPDNPERNAVSWRTAFGPGGAFRLPVPGAIDDPRCNGDPEGTVKATIRFFSDSSGQDTGLIDLPCERWIAATSTSSFSGEKYVYKDARLEDGPCKKVLLKRRNRHRVKAVCLGRGVTTDFPYDLMEGVDEGRVFGVVRLGRFKYCSGADAFEGRDGSDGRRFDGRGSPQVDSCRELGSPGAAFLDVSFDGCPATPF